MTCDNGPLCISIFKSEMKYFTTLFSNLLYYALYTTTCFFGMERYKIEGRFCTIDYYKIIIIRIDFNGKFNIYFNKYNNN